MIAPLLAATPPAPDGFETVTGPMMETVKASPLVVAAYSFIWVVLLAFVAILWRRQAAVRAEVDDLKRKVAR